jgi:sigma-B regulation protein RsbU (phosphoserine phosphatase)
MASEIDSDVRRGLVEKRNQLDQWRENSTEEERDCCLASEEEINMESHLHVIDNTIERIEAGTFGICEVCNETVDNELLQMDYTTSVCLGHYSEEELRKLEAELELSQVVQRALLPQSIPSLPGLDVAAFNRPSDIVGGDYFDFLQFKDGSAGFVIADVSGHGVSSGMLMTSLQTAFHTLVPESLSPAEVLQRINRLYIHNINFTTFVTIFFGRMEMKNNKMTYSNAGHNPGLLFRRTSGDIQRLEPTNAAVGLVENFASRSETAQLFPGDRLLLYTDGVTEAFNADAEFFGEQRLADMLRQHADLPSKDLVKNIRESLSDFVAGNALADDVTLVAIGIQ